MHFSSKQLVTPFTMLLVIAISLPAVLHSYANVAIRIVRTGSMEPALQPGDAVVVHSVPAVAIREGDIALLFHPNDGEIEAHRVLTVDESTTGIALVTKGDANPASDPAITVPRRSAVERAVFTMPKFGYFITIFGSTQFLGGLCALGLMVLIAFEIHDRRRRTAPAPVPITMK